MCLVSCKAVEHCVIFPRHLRHTSSVCDTCPSVRGSSSAVGGAARMLWPNKTMMSADRTGKWDDKPMQTLIKKTIQNTIDWCLYLPTFFNDYISKIYVEKIVQKTTAKAQLKQCKCVIFLGWVPLARSASDLHSPCNRVWRGAIHFFLLPIRFCGSQSPSWLYAQSQLN